MSRRDEHLDEVLCFCHGIEQASGHPLGTEGCTATVKAGSYTPTPHPSVTTESGSGMKALATYGTCPECRRRIRVVRIETRGAWGKVLPRLPGETKAAYRRRKLVEFGEGGETVGPLLQIAPAMAPHRHAGGECLGTGRVPTETRYTPGRRLADWQRANGDAVRTAS